MVESVCLREIYDIHKLTKCVSLYIFFAISNQKTVFDIAKMEYLSFRSEKIVFQPFSIDPISVFI